MSTIISYRSILVDYEVYKWSVLCAYFPLLSFLTTIVFAFVALRGYSEFTMISTKITHKHKQLKLLGIVICSMYIWQYFKSALEVALWIENVRSAVPFGEQGLLEFSYYTIFEFIPCTFVLVFLYQMKKAAVRNEEKRGDETGETATIIPPTDEEKQATYEDLFKKGVFKSWDSARHNTSAGTYDEDAEYSPAEDDDEDIKTNGSTKPTPATLYHQDVM